MDEDLERMMAELVAGLAPEEYERWGPALREFGLALAESRQAEREARRMGEATRRAQEFYEQAQDAYERVLADLDRAQERSRNALRLLEDAL
jgi:hypothetical protein